jgi:hypothetical protein
MLFALLLFGTPWFWAALIIPYFILVALVENERGGWAFFVVTLSAVLWAAFGQKGIVPWVLSHPKDIALYALEYVGIGIGYSIIKWWRYLVSALKKYTDYRTAWVKKNGEINDQPSAKFRGQTNKESFLDDARASGVMPPKVINNKGRIIYWMSYWPFSAFWFILNDPLRHLWNFLYERLGSIFESISKAVFAKYNSDFEVKKPDTTSV